MDPLVSVVIPVYNSENFLGEALNSILMQTYKNLEIICVDDGSTDSSPKILEEYKNKDKRISVYRKKNGGGAGATRNYGLERATGDYLYFFDSDDIANKDLIKKSVEKAIKTDSDIVVFNGFIFRDNDINNKERKYGYNREVLNNCNKEVFSYKDFPDSILNLINVVPWNKLVRREIVINNNIRYDEISSSDDVTFSALCVLAAKRISVLEDSLIFYRVGHAGSITSGVHHNLLSVRKALESTENQIKILPCAKEIKLSLLNFILKNYCFAFSNYTMDFDSPQCKEFYNFLRQRFSEPDISSLRREDVSNKHTYAAYLAVTKHTYEEMLEMRSRDITVTFTSYPSRITYVHSVIENLAAQTIKPTRVLLWLSKKQFEGGNESLPQNLLDCVARGEVEIKWCVDDLRSHKKYYYAMKEYPNDIIITVDDDLVYPKDMIFNLYQSYLAFPECISGMRVHVICADNKTKKILDYSKWIKQFDMDFLIPSTQFFATTGAGCLFPPGILDARVFDTDKIRALCPYADDIWVNMMALVNGVKTVCAVNHFYLNYCAPQDDGLITVNVDQGKNGEQYEAVKNWLESELGKDYFYNIICGSDCGYDLNDPLKIIDYSEYLRAEVSKREKKLNKTYAEKSEINAKLQKTYGEKAERGIEIKKLTKENQILKQKLENSQRELKSIRNSKLYKFYKIAKKIKNHK